MARCKFGLRETAEARQGIETVKRVIPRESPANFIFRLSSRPLHKFVVSFPRRMASVWSRKYRPNHRTDSAVWKNLRHRWRLLSVPLVLHSGFTRKE